MCLNESVLEVVDEVHQEGEKKSERSRGIHYASKITNVHVIYPNVK